MVACDQCSIEIDGTGCDAVVGEAVGGGVSWHGFYPLLPSPFLIANVQRCASLLADHSCVVREVAGIYWIGRAQHFCGCRQRLRMLPDRENCVCCLPISLGSLAALRAFRNLGGLALTAAYLAPARAL